VDDRRMENRILREERIESRWIVSADEPMPGFQWMFGHCVPPAVVQLEHVA
jgi:hypothetical protein